MTETDRLARDYMDGNMLYWGRDDQGVADCMSPRQRRQARRLREAVSKCLTSHPEKCRCFVGMGEVR